MRLLPKTASTVVAALCLAVIALAAMGCAPADRATEGHKISSVSYVHQLAEVGDATEYVLSRSTGDNVTLRVRHYPSAGNPRSERTYTLDAGAMESVEKICDTYGVLGWPEKAEKSEIEVLDAEERSFEITLSDGTSISFSQFDKLPGNGSKVVSQLSQTIEGLAEEGRG